MTTDTPLILRASPQDFIEISGIEKFNDGSGYKSRLTISAGRFSCSEHPFYFDDLKKFTKDLTRAYDHVEGKAWIGDIHEKDFVEIEVSKRGSVSVSGFIQEFSPDRRELRFCFLCDQTFLPEFLRSLNQAAKELEGKP